MLFHLNDFLSNDAMKNLYDNQANLYLKYNQTIKKCPRPGCTYAGFINKTSQTDYFCELCNMCWEEPRENIGSALSKLQRHVDEVFNII